MTDEHWEALKQRIIDHCRWMYTFDKAKSIAAFDRYAELLPWLGLERKK